MSRELDLVVFGATGFTGGLVVEYLAKKIGQGDEEAKGLRWALAGRDETKLQKVRASAAKIAPSLEKLTYIVVDSSDSKGLAVACARTRVVLTTIGPYTKYGEPLVEACVKSGTHYCDLTGEIPWIRKMVEKYHEQAKSTGSRIVHCSGFDSIPADLGALFVANYLQTEKKTKARSVNAMVIMKNSQASGGTLASAMTVMEMPISELKKTLDPYSLNTQSSRAALKGKERKEERDLKWVKQDPDLGLVMPFVMAAGNCRIVRRSVSLAHESFPETKNPYGSNFSYNESLKAPSYFMGAIVSLLMVVAVIFLRIGFVRKLLNKYVLTQPGDGPSAEQRAKASFRYELVGIGEDGTKVRGEVSGGDPGYGETAKMISETALSLAMDLDSAPNMTGDLTPATACGLPLIKRLQKNGLTFKILDTK